MSLKRLLPVNCRKPRSNAIGPNQPHPSSWPIKDAVRITGVFVAVAWAGPCAVMDSIAHPAGAIR